MQFISVRLPPNTNIEMAKAVSGSNAPIIDAGVEPIMRMLRVTNTNDITVGNRAKPIVFIHMVGVESGGRFLPNFNKAKKSTTPVSMA